MFVNREIQISLFSLTFQFGHKFSTSRVGTSRAASAMSDVYSFGVFLLELVTGQEALRNEILGSNESLVQWVSRILENLATRW